MKCNLCDSKAIGRGLCRRHYQQAWKAKTLGDHEPKIGTPENLKRRLLSKYTVAPNGCWEWTGQRKKSMFAYGLIWCDDGPKRAHRVSYELHKEPIPEGLDILHSCDNPPCINPDHLSVGTRGENCTDAASRDRFPLNDDHHNTKLSVEQVGEIRAHSHLYTHAELARVYKVHPATIARIRQGKRRSKA